MKHFRTHRRLISSLMIALMAFWQIGQPLHAATFYWDSDANASGNNADGTGLGGTGDWDTTTANWWNLTDDVAWPNTTTDRAIFSGPFVAGAPTLHTVTLSSGIIANQLSFLRSGYTLTGGDITLGGTTPGLHANLGESATVSSLIAGTNGLTMTGGGSIRLTNVGNSYTGATTIANGSLIISDPAALGGTGSVNIVTTNNTPLNTNSIGFGGGSLVLDGTAGGFTFARDVDFEGQGPIGGRGSAILSLGNNTLSGTLRSAISPLPLSPTATIRSSRINSVNGTLTLSGTLNVGGTAGTTVTSLGGINSAGVGSFSLTGVVAGTGTLEKSGAGTLFLTPSDTSGFSGHLRVSGASTGQQSSVRVTQATVGGTSIFGAGTGTTTASAIDLNGAGLAVLEFRNDGDLDFGALASGKNVYNRNRGIIFTGPAAGGAGINGTTTLGALHQNASGTASTNTTTFGSRNGFGLTFTTLTSDASTSAGTITNTLTNNMGGTLRFTGNVTRPEGSTASRPRPLVIGGNGNTIIQGSIISGTDPGKTLTKSGSGSLTIQGTATTVAGTISINGGAIIATDFRSLNNNSATINIGTSTTAGALIIGTATAPSAAGLTTSKVINLAGTRGGASIYANQTGVNPVILNGDFTTTGGAATDSKTLTLGGTNTADNIINGTIENQAGATTGAVSITKIGSGTWVLAGANTFTGTTTITNGTLKLKANAASSTILPSTNAVTFGAVNGFSGGTLEFVGQDGVNNVQSLGTLAYAGSGSNTIRLIPGAGGTASLTFANIGTGGAGTLNIVGADFTNNRVTMTQVNAAVGSNGILTRSVYWEGADFAFRQGGVLRAPVYGTDAGTSTSASALTAATTNEITGSFSTNTLSIANLKIAGSQTLTLNAAQTLTVSAGGVLATGGSSSITGGTALAVGAQVLVTRVNLVGDTLDIGSVITGTAGITKSGAGTLILSVDNSVTGTITLNEGTIRLSGSGDLGGGNAVTIRQGATLDLNGITPANNINAFNNNGTVTSATAATLTVGGSNGTGDSRGIVSGAISLTKLGTGAQSWLGNSTYTGVTTIDSTGLVTVNTLADGGVASGIGASTNAASNLVFNGSTGGLVYAGNIENGNLNLGSTSASTDRLFTLAGTGARLSSTVSNNNAIIWSNTGAIVHGVTGPQLLTFDGTSTGDNTFNPQITDSGTVADITSVTKTGAGQWNLGNSNNTHTGTTTVGNGILALNDNGALPANSPVVLGSTTTNGILQMSGTLARNLTTTPTAGTGTITWGGTTGGGGFAAHATALTVTLDGGAGLTWGSGGFVGTGGTQALIFNSASALSDVTFTNAIDLGASARTITVNDNANTGADYATLSGVLSGAGGGILKNGTGVLRIGNTNTYTGITQVQAGTLVVQSLGNSTGGGSSSVGADGVTMDNTNAIQLGAGGNNAGILQYVGPGETSDRKIRFNSTTGSSSTNQIHADGSGPLILTNVANDMAAGAKSVVLRGSNTAGNMITSQLSDNGGALSITVDGGATWILTNSANNYTGTTTVSAGALGIGHNTAIGAALTNSNGNIFAYGGDRTLTNTLNLGNNATSAFIGDYSLIFNGTNNLAAGANNVTLSNSIAAGKALTFNGLLANSLTATRAWTMGGNGETIINGSFTTSTAFGVNITYSGNGILNLGTDGATSNWNQANNVLDLDRGTLKFTANEAIPTFGAATPTTTAAVAASTTIPVTSTAGLTVGQQFSVGGTVLGRIASIDSETQFTANVAQTIADSATLTFAASGGLTISPELATTDTATVDLNGTTQTVNALTATSNGTLSIDNSSATAATFRFGANNTNVDFGSGVGTYSILNTGDGALSLVKLGNTTATFISGITLAHEGITASEGGGVWTIASPLTATTGLRAIEASTLSLSGGLTSPGTITSIEVGAGSTLGLLHGAGSAISNLTTLSLGNTGTGTVTLNLNVGDMNTNTDRLNTDTLTLLTGGTLNLGNTITFNLTDAGLNANQTYTLLNLIDGGITAFGVGSMIQGATPGGFDSFTWNVTNNLVQLTTGNLITGASWWNADGALDNWNDVANWSVTNKGGLTPAVSTPGQGTDVVFIADNIAGGGSITTTLEQNFKINSLTFEASTNPADTPSSVTINPGALPTARLEIAPQFPADGIAITAGGPAIVNISAPLRIGADQTWTVADASAGVALTGATFATASTAITVASTTGLQAGMVVVGAGIPAGATVASVTNATSFVLSTNTTAAGASIGLAASSGLILSGGLQGEADVTKAGLGKVILTAAADPTFNGGQTATFTVTGGNLEMTNTASLGTAANSNLANVTINTGGAFYFNGAASTIANALTLNGGTLSSGTNNQIYSGAVNISGDSFINLRDSNSFVLTTTPRAVTLSGPLSGTGDITLDSINTVSAGNQITGDLVITNPGNSGWSGDLIVRSGTVTARTGNGDALGTGAIHIELGKVEWEGAGGVTYNLNKALTIARSGGNAVAEWNIDRTSGTGTFTVANSGAVTLGGAGGTGELRVFFNDIATNDVGTTANFSGPVVLANDAAISVRDNATLALSTFSGVISESGGSRSLTVNGPAGGGTAWGGTAGILRLTGLNTFTGNVTLAGGTLEFDTVTNISGGSSALGNGTAITTGSGTLRFIGTASQATDRPITQTGATIYGANGTGGATITYNGAITAAANNFTLTGLVGSAGNITAGITQTGTTADATVNGGTWTLSGTQSTVADDFVVSGTNAVLNLNSTGVVRIMSGSASADLTIRGGATVNINAANAIQYTGTPYRLFVGQGADGADATLNLNANLQSGRFILGERSLTRVGIVNGPGTLTVDNAAASFIQLYRGEINANLASNGTGAGIFHKVGSGTVTLRGDNSGLTNTGINLIDDGTLVLDYTLNNASKVNALRQLDMRGSTLQIVGNASAATTQNVLSFTMATGAGNNIIDVTAGTGQTATLSLGAITRAASAGTLRINLNNSGAAVITNTLNTNGIVGLAGYTTVKDTTGTWFGTNSTNLAGGSIVGLASTLNNTVTSWTSGDHITDGGSGFVGGFDRSHINSLRFDAAGGSALTAASQASVLTIGSGGILVTDQVTSGSPGIFGGTLGTGASEIIVTQDSSQTFEISSRIGVNNAFTKTGPGTVLLSGNSASTGAVSVQNGVLQLSGGNAIGDTSIVTLASNRNSTLQLLASETIGRLQGGQRNTNSDYGTVAVGSHTLTLNHAGGNTTYAGVFTGSGGIVMSTASASNLALTGISTGFTGTVEVNGGLFQLVTSGRIDASSITINGNGMMLIDNNGNTSSTTRILDTTPIILNSAAGGGTNIRGLWVRNTDVNASRFETIGDLVFNSGASYLTGDANDAGATENGRAGIIASNFVRNDNATVSVRGRNLGTTLQHHNQFRIGTAGNQTAFIGTLVGGGGTAASPTISIVPWAIGETHNATATASANMGNSLVTYVSGAGFRPLDFTTEYASYATAGATNNTRESRTTDLTLLDGRTLNSLVIDNNNTATINITGSGAGQTLTNTSGAFLFTISNGAASSAYATNLGGFDDGIATTAGEYIFHVVNPSAATTSSTLTATISSPLTSAADLTKSGRGTLILNQVNTAGGGANKTTLNEGILEIADLDNIGGGTGSLVFAGGTLRLGAGLTDDISTRSISFLTGGGTLDTNGIDLTLANSLGSGVGGFTKAGAGNLTLNGSATYTGNTVLALGTVTVGANNALGNGGNLTLAGGTTLALGANSLTHNVVTTGGASPQITGTGTLSASTGFAFNHTGNTQIDAVLAGSGGLLKTQNNILTLGGASTYTGTTEVRAGGLSFDSIGNVGGGASALGNPGTIEDGIIRMGLTTAATSLTYTGLGHSSDRLIGMQGTTVGVTLNGSGTGALVLTGGTRFETPGNKTLVLRGSSDAVIDNSIGGLTESGGVLTLNKADANTWLINGGNTYTGVTQIDNGTLKIGLSDALPTGTTVRLGTGATAGTFDLNGFNQTITSLLVQTNNNAVTNNLIVDTGNTLTISGAVTIGVNANESDTNFNASGGGAVVVNSAGANFQIGGATGTANENRVDVDFTGLDSFTANLGAGTFRLGDAATGTGDMTSTFKLATDNTITAASIRIGDGTGGGQVHTLTLGSGSNVLNGDTINVGSAGANIRSSGSVIFDPGDTTGTVTVRAFDGSSRTTINMVNTTGNTATDISSTINLTGHTADILASTLTMASRTQAANAATATFSFDQGTLDITTLNMASRTGAGTGNATATVNLGDSAAPGTPAVTIGAINMAVNTSADGAVTADLNITGGNVTIGAINLANAGTDRTVTSNVTLSGGTVTLSGNITRTGGAGTENATVTLNGSTLDMNGNSIGTGAAQVNLLAQSGTLQNLAQLNGGGALTKTTTGLLILEGTNTYTGATDVNAGILQVGTAGAGQSGSGTVTVASGATLAGTGMVVGSTIIGSGAVLQAGDVTMAGDAASTLTGTGTLTFTAAATALTVQDGGQIRLGVSSPTLDNTVISFANGVFTFNGTDYGTAKDLFDNEATALTLWNVAPASQTNHDYINLTGMGSTLSIGDRASGTFGDGSVLVGGMLGSVQAGQVFNLIDWSGAAITGNFDVGGFNRYDATNNVIAGDLDLMSLGAGFGYDVSAFTTYGIVVIVPEPSRALLLLFGLLGLMLRRRRR